MADRNSMRQVAQLIDRKPLAGHPNRRFGFRFHDEPSNGIEIITDHPATEAQGFDNGRTTAHEWIEDDLVVGIRIIRMILVELRP